MWLTRGRSSSAGFQSWRHNTPGTNSDTYKIYLPTGMDKFTSLFHTYGPDLQCSPSSCIQAEGFIDYNNALANVTKQGYPENEPTNCVMLLVSNLANPDWVFIKCGQRLLMDIVCYNEGTSKQENNSSENYFLKSIIMNCSKDETMFDKCCLSFAYFIGSAAVAKTQLPRCLSNIRYWRAPQNRQVPSCWGHEKAKKWLIFMSDVIRNNFPSLIEFSNSTHATRFTLRKEILSHAFFREEAVSSWYYMEKKITPKEAMAGFFIFGRSNIVLHKRLVFQCPNNEYISTTFECDGNINCIGDFLNGTRHDEAHCKWDSLLFYMSENGKYRSYKTQTSAQLVSEHNKAPTNFTPNCNTSNSAFENLCSPEFPLSCGEGSSACYSIRDICVFRLIKVGSLVPCGKGSHMAKCIYFQCNGHFKCPRSHCIPYSYICDGKWVCTAGEDEQLFCSRKRLCPGLLHCHNSEVCIHPHDVCDNRNDCPDSEDEHMCELNNTECPNRCTCFHFAVLCINVTLGHSQKAGFVTPHIALHFIHCEINSLQYFQNYRKSVLVLYTPHNNISSI